MQSQHVESEKFPIKIVYWLWCGLVGGQEDFMPLSILNITVRCICGSSEPPSNPSASHIGCSRRKCSEFSLKYD